MENGASCRLLEVCRNRDGRGFQPRLPPHALRVGQWLEGSLPKSSAPGHLLGVSRSLDWQSCVSPLPACAPKNKGGKSPGRYGLTGLFLGLHPSPPKINSYESWPQTPHTARPQREARCGGPDAPTCPGPRERRALQPYENPGPNCPEKQ